MGAIFLVPALTPHGHLVLTEDHDAAPLDLELAQRLQNAFARGSGHGLLQLGAGEVGTVIPPVFSYWRGMVAPAFSPPIHAPAVLSSARRRYPPVPALF